MAAFSRGLRPLIPRSRGTSTAELQSLCPRCLFSSSPAVQSGHNRWSKIKHDKGSADLKKNVQRSILSHEITLASKLYGGDPNTNSKLASILVNAKKAGFPKASMEAAIARGQGKSASGAALENMTLEVIMPPSVAMIIECETDNRARTLADLRHMIKKHGGNATPTSYLFQKKGRLAFEKDEGGLTVDEVLDDAIEAGAEDVEQDEDGGIVVWTEPSQITAAAEALQKSHGLKVESSDIIWDANEDTKVPLSMEHSDAVKSLSNLLELLRDEPNVQGIYANALQGDLPDEMWENIQENLDA